MQYRCAIFLRADTAIKQHNRIAPGTTPGKSIQRTAHTESMPLARLPDAIDQNTVLREQQWEDHSILA